MKKRVKVFEVGKYPQGEFSDDRLKAIFGSVKDKIQGIFAHTSKWQDEEPLSLGEFSNFSVENGKAYADLELNDKGQSYYADGVIKGISAEIGKTLSRIALLPIGVKPAVAGAEFAEYEDVIMEFEEITEEPAEEPVKEREVKQMTEIELKGFAKEQGFDIEIKQTPVPKSEEEIRTEIRTEFEAKQKADKELMEFEAIVDKKILPAHKQAYILAFKANQSNAEVVEFEEGKMTATENLRAKVAGMADLTLTEEFAKAENKEQLTKRQEAIKRMEDAKKRAEGGNK